MVAVCRLAYSLDAAENRRRGPAFDGRCWVRAVLGEHGRSFFVIDCGSGEVETNRFFQFHQRADFHFHAFNRSFHVGGNIQ